MKFTTLAAAAAVALSCLSPAVAGEYSGTIVFNGYDMGQSFVVSNNTGPDIVNVTVSLGQYNPGGTVYQHYQEDFNGGILLDVQGDGTHATVVTWDMLIPAGQSYTASGLDVDKWGPTPGTYNEDTFCTSGCWSFSSVEITYADGRYYRVRPNDVAWNVDNIMTWGVSAVPEPSTSALMLLGCAAIFARRRKT